MVFEKFSGGATCDIIVDKRCKSLFSTSACRAAWVLFDSHDLMLSVIVNFQILSNVCRLNIAANITRFIDIFRWCAGLSCTKSAFRLVSILIFGGCSLDFDFLDVRRDWFVFFQIDEAVKRFFLEIGHFVILR